jgi:AAHS family 3-hydroxyphenylpropionic acid transporter
MTNAPYSSLRFFLFGSVIATFASIGGWLLAPIESRFVSALTDNSLLVGATFAVGTAAFSILALILGRLADRLGRERVVVASLVVGVIFPFLYASSVNVLMYMGVELLWAFAAVGVGPVLLAYLQDMVKYRPNRGHLMSLMYGSMSLSGAVGHFTGGWVADMYGLTGPYYVLAGVYFITLILALYLFFRLQPGIQTEIAAPTKAEENEQHGLDTASFLFGIRYVFQKPVLVYYFIINGAFAMNYSIKVLLWPLIVAGLIERPIVMGVIFAGTGVTAFFILLFSGKVVDSRGAILGVHIAFAALLLGGFMMAFTHSFVWFGIGAALFAVGEAFYGSAQTVLLVDNVANKHRGEILGVDRVFDSSFATIAMLLSGYLLSVWSPQSAWLFFMIILMCAYGGAQLYRGWQVGKL